MSESPRMAHAVEVSRWTLLLLGWLWLGEQGMRLGWSMASGVLAVALWWAVRIAGQGNDWALKRPVITMGACGLLTAWGVWWPSWLADPVLAHVALLVLAVLWGFWSVLVENRARFKPCRRVRFAWHPLLAAALVWAAWRSSALASGPLGVSILLGLCCMTLTLALKLGGHRQRTVASPPKIVRWSVLSPARSVLSTLLPASAMGLMMGSLWLGNGWCAGLNLTTEQMVLAHISLMAGLPVWVNGVLTRPRVQGAGLSTDSLTWISQALLATGALALLGDSATHGLLAMLLPSLAWAVQGARRRVAPLGLAPSEASEFNPRQLSTHSRHMANVLALLLGPFLLVWVGWVSPLQGPWGLQSVLGLLGALAAAQLLWGAWRSWAPWPRTVTGGP